MVVDIIIIAIILLSTFLAYRKGLVKLAIGLVAFLIAIVVTVLLYKPVTNLVINVTTIDEGIQNIIYEKANDVMEKDTSDKDLKGQIVDNVKNNMLPETARNISVYIVTGGVFILLFVLVRVALIFVTALADAVTKLPILKQINKAGGIIYGILRGLLIVYVLLMVLNVFSQIYPNNKVTNDVEKSIVAKNLSEHNVFYLFVNKIDVNNVKVN